MGCLLFSGLVLANAAGAMRASVLTYLSLLVLEIAAGFALLGHNWARWLLLGFFGWRTAVFIRYGTAEQVAVGLLWLTIAGYFLFRPNARQFFRGTTAQQSGDIRKGTEG
jgi:hypothetical protein